MLQNVINDDTVVTDHAMRMMATGIDGNGGQQTGTFIGICQKLAVFFIQDGLIFFATDNKDRDPVGYQRIGKAERMLLGISMKR